MAFSREINQQIRYLKESFKLSLMNYQVNSAKIQSRSQTESCSRNRVSYKTP